MDTEYIIETLLMLETKKDPIKYHPEDNLLSHVVQAYNHSKRETDDLELRTAALFHDIGKVVQNEDHPIHSVRIMSDFGYHNSKVFQLIANHMRIRWYLSGRMKKLGKLDKLLAHKYFREIVMLRRFDRMGREPDVDYLLNIDEVWDLLIETHEGEL